ncbi:MAG: cupin domain-containing protein [Candidatus Thiodiazotropha sp. (ex Epidulcina cf. delphinae)]|nr:cupin domain-containing protein [Candidatus Thiodiazotropha sp. (ex Epidulcina cf. delphinae)]
MSSKNLFKPDTAAGEGETFDTLLKTKNIAIERILSPPGTSTTITQQPHDEWVCVLQGSARLEMADEHLNLHRGDSALIPAHTPHRVITTSHQPHCIWLAVHIL